MIFADTSFFKAFVDEKDDFHEDAVRILMKIETSNENLLTTNYILDETVTLIRVKCGLEKVRDLKKALEEVQKIIIRRVLPVDEKNAWNWFWNDWSNLSFTDCVSFALMKRLDLKRVATFDEHFQRAGFEVEGI